MTGKAGYSSWNINDNIALRALADAFPVGMATEPQERMDMAAIMYRRLREMGYAVVRVAPA